MKYGTCIKGVGAYIPEEIRENDFWPEVLVEHWQKKKEALREMSEDAAKKVDYIHPVLREELGKISADPFFGLKRRRVAPKEMLPSEMECIAAEDALKNAGIKPEDVEVLMLFSLPPDRIIHPNCFAVHQKMNLKNALAFTVHAICFSIPVMMNIAQRFISQGVYSNILAVASTKYSAIQDYTSSISVMAGDGAGAIVLGPCKPGEGIISTVQRTDSTGHDAMIVTRRPTLNEIEKKKFDYGEVQTRERVFFTVNDHQKAKEVITKIPYWAEATCLPALQQANLQPDDIDLLITNAATAWYSRSIAKILGIDTAKIEDNILEFNNMGAVNLPVNLYTALKNGRIKAGDNLLVFGHGGGSSHGAMVVRWV